MAPSIRSTIRPSTPMKPRKRKEYDTIKKARFFDAYDDRKPGVSLRTVADEYTPSFSTAQRWLNERAKLGSLALRRTRKLIKRLGPSPRVSLNTYKILVSPSRNPVRDQQYEAQIVFHSLLIKRRTLQKRLKLYIKGGQRYK
jgi:hypothetical protein